MRSLKTVSIILTCLLLTRGASTADELGDAVRAAVALADDAIVRIRIVGGEQSIEGETVSSQITSGLVVSDAGEILTSLFAVNGRPQAILVQDADRKTVNATIVATDHIRRLVLLKADAGRWVAVTPAPAETVRIGQWTVAAGRFYTADECNVSVGILSAVNRIHGLALQTDAKVSPVNYGGPLLDLNGRALGVLVPLSPRGDQSASAGVEWYDSGIGFAIPIADALQVADQLRAGKDRVRGRLGLSPAASTPFDSDIRIRQLAPGGPAEKAGLKPDDRITSINGRIVARASMLEEIVARSYAGETLEVEVDRGGTAVKVAIELVAALPEIKVGYFGFLLVRRASDKEASDIPDVAAIAKMLRDRQAQSLPLPVPNAIQPIDEPDEQVTEPLQVVIADDSPAANAGLPTKVELLQVNEIDIKSARDLRLATGSAAPGQTLTFTYRIPGTTNVQTADITAADIPESVATISDSILSALSSRDSTADPSAAPQRRETTFEDQGKVVFFSSTADADIRPGLVLLLSAHDQTEEDVLRQWQPYLASRRLAVVIPKTPESGALTRDDTPLILAALQAAGTELTADLRRVVVVADQAQAELGWQLLAEGPSPIGGLALTNGWLSVARIQEAEGTGMSVMLADRGDSAPAQALLDQSALALKTSGFKVVRQSADDQTRAIADWTLWLTML